jgi:hypothetical protein
MNSPLRRCALSVSLLALVASACTQPPPSNENGTSEIRPAVSSTSNMNQQLPGTTGGQIPSGGIPVEIISGHKNGRIFFFRNGAATDVVVKVYKNSVTGSPAATFNANTSDKSTWSFTPVGNPGGDVTALYLTVEGTAADQLFVDGTAEIGTKRFKYYTPIKGAVDAQGNRSFTTPVGIIVQTDIQ